MVIDDYYGTDANAKIRSEPSRRRFVDPRGCLQATGLLRLEAHGSDAGVALKGEVVP